MNDISLSELAGCNNPSLSAAVLLANTEPTGPPGASTVPTSYHYAPPAGHIPNFIPTSTPTAPTSDFDFVPPANSARFPVIPEPAQKDADLNPLGSKKRKKRGDPSPSHERQVKPKRAAKQTTYVFIFIPFTKDINRGHCNVPAPHLLSRLDGAGYVKDIILCADDSPADISTKILINFGHISELDEHGFRLLRVARKMRLDKRGSLVPKLGVPRVLRTLKRDLDLTAIKM
ncbi:hypothetical protein B0H14DRAFT_3439997 [Mycena olivaceomarginata]|nr:hypothetical protein B0H14DRAFT_3439997 [Mycena olivaceomarginata]